MSEGDPQDEGERLLNDVARSLEPGATGADLAEALAREFERRRAHERVDRGPERRVRERRALGFTARRESDADLNRRRREFLFRFLSRLPREDLLLWIDGMWLGMATEFQLAAAEAAATLTAAQTASHTSAARRRGRPRVDRLLPTDIQLFDPSDPYVRNEWRILTGDLHTLSQARRQHRARMNRTRRGTPRSLDIRNGCLRSPIGQRANKVGLFAEFFDDESDGAMLTPSEMAARLLHRELQEHFSQRAARFKAAAAKAPTTDRRDLYSLCASRAERCLTQLPTWRTLHRKLRSRRSKGPAPII